MKENLGICKNFSLKKMQTLECKIGCLRLWVRRVETEILVGSILENEVDEDFVLSENEIPENFKITRWAWKENSFVLSFKAILQDKDLVFRPTKPISVPSKGRVDFYVSPCVRLQICFNEKFIMNLPIIEYSETWFGKDPTIGDLCYAVKTRATTNPQNIIRKKYRFLCHLSVANESDEPITIDKVKVLTEYIRLYQDENGFILSDELLLRHTAGHSIKMVITSPDSRARGLEKIYDARTKFQAALLSTFSVIMDY